MGKEHSKAPVQTSGRRARTGAKSISDRLNGEGNKIPYMQLLYPG